MKVEELKRTLNLFSKLKVGNYLLDVSHRNGSILRNSSTMIDVSTVINRFTLIRDGKYTLTTYDTAKLADSCNRLLQELEYDRRDDYMPISHYDYNIHFTKKGFEIYRYDSILNVNNKYDEFELFSTSSRLFRFFIKKFKLI